MKASPPADDTRARILRTAHDLFRHYGHAKTTVADVAEACGMSPANVYRYFSSKAAINDAICEVVVTDLEADLRRIAIARVPAARRLARLINRVADFTREIHAEERPLHDMIDAAVCEGWAPIHRHIALTEALFAAVVADGIAAGEFAGRDPAHLVRCLCFSLIGFRHPTAAVQCRELSDVPAASELTAFLLSALRPLGPGEVFEAAGAEEHQPGRPDDRPDRGAGVSWDATTDADRKPAASSPRRPPSPS